MSSEKTKEYITYDVKYKPNEKNKIFIMIYKPNENKKEKLEIFKELKKKGNYFLSDEKEYSDDVIRIFGKYFVKQNKNRCKIIYNNKKYELKEYFDEINNNYNHDIKEIKLKLIGINNISNFEQMFYGCCHLSSLSKSKSEYFRQCVIELHDTFSYIDSFSSLLEMAKVIGEKKEIILLI